MWAREARTHTHCGKKANHVQKSETVLPARIRGCAWEREKEAAGEAGVVGEQRQV